MRIDIVIPAYNEEDVIRETVTVLAKATKTLPDADWRIVVSDNASTDRTSSMVRSIGDGRIQVIRIEKRGKGAAVREAFARSQADVVMFFDADLSVHPSAIKEALQLIVGGTDIVIGSRFHGESRTNRGFLRTLSSQIFNVFARTIVGIRVSDSQCGFKAMNKKGQGIMCRTTENGWFFDLEFLAHAARTDLVLKEMPVAWTEFTYPDRESKLRHMRDGLSAIVAMFRIRSKLQKR